MTTRRNAAGQPPGTTAARRVVDLERYAPALLDWIATKVPHGASQHCLNVFSVGIEVWRYLLLLAIEESISAQQVSRIIGMVRALEVLGDTVALRGNLSPTLLTTGPPHEVDAAVKHLVDTVRNKGGKLIPDGAFGIADETPVENVRAMFGAARKYAG